MFAKILGSTASNVFNFCVMTVVTFVMTPVYVRELGNYDYGVWEIIVSVFGYLGLVDLGLRPTISRFTAKFRGEQNDEERRALFTTSLTLMGIVGLIVALVFLGWSLLGPGILAEQPASASRYALVLQLLALSALIEFPRAALESTFEGQLQYAMKNNLTLLHSIAAAMILYHFLPLYDPLILLCTVSVVSSASRFVLFSIVLRRPRYGSNRWSFKQFSVSLGRQMYRFGFKSFMQSIAAKVQLRTDVLIIGAVVGPQAVVFYSLPLALISRIKSFSQILTHALMPAFSELSSAGDGESLKRVFLVSSRVIVALFVLMTVGALMLGADFIGLWIGPEYGERGRVVLWCLTAYLMISTLIPASSRFLTAIDRHGVLAKIAIVEAALNLGISLVLVRPLGIAGVALGSAAATTCVAPFIWRAVMHHLGLPSIAYLRSVLMPSAAAAGCMVAALVLSRDFLWVTGWLALGKNIVIGTGAYCAVFLTIGISKPERARIVAALRGRAAISG